MNRTFLILSALTLSVSACYDSGSSNTRDDTGEPEGMIGQSSADSVRLVGVEALAGRGLEPGATEPLDAGCVIYEPAAPRLAELSDSDCITRWATSEQDALQSIRRALYDVPDLRPVEALVSAAFTDAGSGAHLFLIVARFKSFTDGLDDLSSVDADPSLSDCADQLDADGLQDFNSLCGTGYLQGRAGGGFLVMAIDAPREFAPARGPPSPW